MAEPFLGEIRLFPFNQVPHGWSTCQGQTLSVQQYAALYALLGITYGGNGTTTFLLPDLRGRAALHFGTTAKLGAPAGTENVTLLIENLPPHTHLLGADMAAATQSSANEMFLASAGTSNQLIYAAPGTPTVLDAATLLPTGGSQGHSNMQPYLVLQYCIALVGIFPMRG